MLWLWSLIRRLLGRAEGEASVGGVSLPGTGPPRYGALPVPGSAEFDLPAGKVRLTYQESREASTRGADNDAILFAAPTGLEVAVVPTAGGPPLAVKRGLMDRSRKMTRPGQSRARVGSVKVTEPASYTVTAVISSATPSPLIDLVEPQILVG